MYLSVLIVFLLFDVIGIAGQKTFNINEIIQLIQLMQENIQLFLIFCLEVKFLNLTYQTLKKFFLSSLGQLFPSGLVQY